MRLFNVDTKQLELFYDADIPKYAILSHTWGKGEVTFQDLECGNVASMAGYLKIAYTCNQARSHGYRYFWMDTCCIDKTSSTELSEAINSMWKWYQNAEVCYAYLEDVDYVDDTELREIAFAQTRWLTRGWTLQELLAPAVVQFYDRNWRLLGTKALLLDVISKSTGIAKMALIGPEMLSAFSLAGCMSWASQRKTTREEDIAYCLLGIFRVNMPLLYGEGTQAFRRLQEQLIRTYHDQSLFAHNGDEILAIHPDQFRESGNIYPLKPRTTRLNTYSMTNRGLHIDLPILDQPGGKHRFLGILNCHFQDDYSSYIALPLGKVDMDETSDTYVKRYSAIKHLQLGYDLVPSESAARASVQTIFIGSHTSRAPEHVYSLEFDTLHKLSSALDHGYQLQEPSFGLQRSNCFSDHYNQDFRQWGWGTWNADARIARLFWPSGLRSLRVAFPFANMAFDHGIIVAVYQYDLNKHSVRLGVYSPSTRKDMFENKVEPGHHEFLNTVIWVEADRTSETIDTMIRVPAAEVNTFIQVFARIRRDVKLGETIWIVNVSLNMLRQ